MKISNCCAAPAHELNDFDFICDACREHCEAIEETEPIIYYIRLATDYTNKTRSQVGSRDAEGNFTFSRTYNTKEKKSVLWEYLNHGKTILYTSDDEIVDKVEFIKMYL